MMSPTLDFEVMTMMSHPLRRGTNKSSHQAIAPGLDALEEQDKWSDSMLRHYRAVVNEVRRQYSTYHQIDRAGGAGLYLAAYTATFEKEVGRGMQTVRDTCSAYRRHRQVLGKANDEGEWELYGMMRELK
jgi:hypothetical protein